MHPWLYWAWIWRSLPDNRFAEHAKTHPDWHPWRAPVIKLAVYRRGCEVLKERQWPR